MSQKTRKIAVHHLRLPDGTTYGQSVVELNPCGQVIHWHPLDREEPQTEWLGGTARLFKDDDGILMAEIL